MLATYKLILNQQQTWARQRGIKSDDEGYTLSPETKREFESGKGEELGEGCSRGKSALPSQLGKNLSSSSSSKGEEARFYYGWVILATVFVIGLISFGIRFSFGVFFESLEGYFGWSRAQTSGVFSLYVVLTCVFAILGGWALDRYEPKMVAILMGIFTGLSLLLTSHASSFWHLFLSYSLLLAIGTGPAFTIVMSTTLRWFEKKRGLAVGIAGCGSSVGTMVMTPLSAYLISNYGWRGSYFIMSLIAFIIIISCAQLLKRAPAGAVALPEDKKLPATSSPERQDRNERSKFSLLEVARSKNFWLLFSIWFLNAFCVYTIMAHIVRHAIDLGITSIQAASTLSVIGGAGIPGRLLMGRVSDSLGRKQAAIISALLMAGAMLWLIGASNLWMLYLFAIIFGFCYGGLVPPITALIGDIFGMHHIGVIIGVLEVGWAIGAALGPVFAGSIFDITGNYIFAFLAGMTGMLIVAALVLFVRPPAGREGA